MRLAKTAVLLLAAIIIGILIFVFTTSDDTNYSQQQNPQQISNKITGNRADDQTYAEEVKTLTARSNQLQKAYDEQTALMKQEIEDSKAYINSLTQEFEKLKNNVSKDSEKKMDSLSKELNLTKEKLNAAVNSLSESSKKSYEKLTAQLEKVNENKSATGETLSEFEIMKQNINNENQKKKEEKPIEVIINPPSNNSFKTPINNAGFNSNFSNQFSGGQSLTPDGYLAIKPFGDSDKKNSGSVMGSLADGSFWGIPQIKPNNNTDNPFDFTIGGGGGSGSSSNGNKQPPKPKPIPIATIPMSAILFDNTSISPLIGVVPDLTNNVNDPFRFRIMTGPENLSSNGINIHGIDNVIWSGYVVGVRDQSCVRAYVDTVTYTFEDGRISTYNKGRSSGGISSTSSQFTGLNSLGYLTDEYGKACIRGEYISNAQKYLADRSMAAFLGGLAEAASQSQMKYLENKDGDLSGFVTGNTGKYVLGAGISGTADEIAKYVADRAAGAMDLIYVQGGVNVQVFIEDEIPIDYDPTARKVNYEYTADDLSQFYQ